MTEQDAYRILGLQKGADTEQIRNKYRELILQVHPDMLTGGSPDSSPAAADVRKIKMRQANFFPETRWIVNAAGTGLCSLSPSF